MILDIHLFALYVLNIKEIIVVWKVRNCHIHVHISKLLILTTNDIYDRRELNIDRLKNKFISTNSFHMSTTSCNAGKKWSPITPSFTVFRILLPFHVLSLRLEQIFRL